MCAKAPFALLPRYIPRPYPPRPSVRPFEPLRPRAVTPEPSTASPSLVDLIVLNSLLNAQPADATEAPAVHVPDAPDTSSGFETGGTIDDGGGFSTGGEF